MKRLLISTIITLALGLSARGQSAIVKDFMPVCDSLEVLIQERNSIKNELKLQAIMRRGTTLDFYFTESLGDYPWHSGETKWFRNTLKSLFPEKYQTYRLGEIYSKRVSHDNLVTPSLAFDGNPSQTRHSTKNPDRRNIVTPLDGMGFSKGLDGRHIALWQSHGYYYDQATERWQWQRPPLFQTVEDMYTQSYVLPYLVPMLENAGAYVLIPRERDVQRNEVIADNDRTDESYGTASYSETGSWSSAGTGFAALKPVYEGLENPFADGTARKAEAVSHGKKEVAEIEWRPEIPERGEYAVYVSYKTLSNSTSAAHYSVHHLGGVSDFVVNQKMGGGTWIYLGTFEFKAGTEGYVSLTNETPEGFRHSDGSVVSADAVRFGGGMGNIARAPQSDKDAVAEISGMPRYAEGARYWMQWAGVSEELFSQNEKKDDYKDDYMSRGDWVEWISRGSDMNQSKKGLGIPVDLALGFHSDAGITQNDSIVGTLAIYTLRSEGSQKLPTGESRMTSREYADLVQSQIVHDLREKYDTSWSRRHIWDRSYRESRTPSAPAMLLELLSHQNFADQKYGLDPTFRFTVSRSVYKGMLKYLSNRYDIPYVVQPLPVESLGVRFAKEDKAEISWMPVIDEIEPTAVPEGYILYTRIDDGGFDGGKVIDGVRKRGGRLTTEVNIKPGHIYSFRIAAFNDGGKSFPSETVSIGKPSEAVSDKAMLVVNNFDRVSGPAFIDTPTYAGFDNRLDSGVPHVRDIAYIGEMHDFRRQSEFVTNDSPGFGASYTEYAGKTVAGNTFDYPYIHGKAVIEAGYPFFSCSNETFCSDSTFRKQAWSVDIVCGKQVTTVVGSGLQKKYEVFPAGMQEALSAFASDGGNILVSGAYIGTDIWDQIYPYEKDKTAVAAAKKFAQNILGYTWAANSASRRGTVRYLSNDILTDLPASEMQICNEINEIQYSVESPDGLTPALKSAASFMRYKDSGISAGICNEGKGYRTVCLGFPIEALESSDDINRIITITLEFFSR